MRLPSDAAAMAVAQAVAAARSGSPVRRRAARSVTSYNARST
nr:hypothetical protein [Streptomyces phaeoluteigriseus]